MHQYNIIPSSQSFLFEDDHPYHVFFARGDGAERKSGNKKYRQLIRSHHHAYKTCRKRISQEKIVQSIIQSISSAGGRFYSKAKKDMTTKSTSNDRGYLISSSSNFSSIVPLSWDELSLSMLDKKVRQSLRDAKYQTGGSTSCTARTPNNVVITNDRNQQETNNIISSLQHQEVEKENNSAYDVFNHEYDRANSQVWTHARHNHHHHHQNYNDPPPTSTSHSIIYEREYDYDENNMKVVEHIATCSNYTIETDVMEGAATTSSKQQAENVGRGHHDSIHAIMNCSIGSSFGNESMFLGNDHSITSNIGMGEIFQLDENKEIESRSDWWIENLILVDEQYMKSDWASYVSCSI